MSDRRQLKRLHARHREIIRRTAIGQKQVEIAEALNITPQNVSDTLRDEMGKAALSIIVDGRDNTVKKMQDQILEMVPSAIDVMQRMMTEDVQENLQLRAAIEVIDAAGVKKVEPQGHLHLHMTGDDIADIKKEAYDIWKEEEEVIDVHFANTEDASQNSEVASGSDSG